VRNNHAPWALLCALVGAGCSAPDFREYTSGDGHFRVLMPGTPREGTDLGIAGLMRKVEVNTRAGAYEVTWQELKNAADATPEGLERRLDGVRNGAVRNIRGTLIDEKKITLGRHPGREIVVDLPEQKGRLRDRLCIAGGRLYQVMVVGREGWVGSPDADRFLDSFRLTD